MPRPSTLAASLALLAMSVIGSPTAAAGSYELVSVTSQGENSTGYGSHSDISADGTIVAFHAASPNLDPTGKGTAHIYVRNRETGKTTLIDKNEKGVPAKGGPVNTPFISPNGRFVGFCSDSPNLVKPDHWEYDFHPDGALHPDTDAFVRDRKKGELRRISTTNQGTEGDDWSCVAAVSNTGDAVFASEATDLISGDTNGYVDVFVYDWQSEQIRRVSKSSSGHQANEDSRAAAISPDGRYVGFYSLASNLIPGDLNGFDAFLRDRESSTTSLLNVGPDGSPVAGNCVANKAMGISGTGRFVFFVCQTGDVVDPPVPYGPGNMYVRDLVDETTEHVGLPQDGEPDEHVYPDVSANIRYVVFWSFNPDYSDADEDVFEDVFLRDRATGTTTLLSPTTFNATWPAAANGGQVTFMSNDPWVPGDTDGELDVYLVRG